MLSAVTNQLLSQARSSSTTRTVAAALSLTVRRTLTGGGHDRLSARELVRLQQQILASPASTQDLLRHPLCPTPVGWFDTNTLDQQLEQLQQEALFQQQVERETAAVQQEAAAAVVPVFIENSSSVSSFDNSDNEQLEDDSSSSSLECMNRNARYAKRANRGKRPCSRQRRRRIKRAFGSWRR